MKLKHYPRGNMFKISPISPPQHTHTHTHNHNFSTFDAFEQISFQGSLRRVSIPIQQHKPSSGLAFADLKAKARDLFNIPSFAQIRITYIDAEGDVVTMTNDDEYRDACVVQALNPLKLEVQVMGSTELVEYGNPSLSSMLKNNKKSSLKRWWPSWLVLPWYSDPEASDKLSFKRWPLFARPKATLPVTHHRVQCDYCGMLPIEGPRYSSTTTPDYDLCATCYKEAGDEKFYIRINTPSLTQPLLEFRKGSGQRINVKDSEENMDVQGLGCKLLYTPNGHQNVTPGSEVSQVWHMQNVGTLPWPKGTQLVPVGGYTLSDDMHVDLELPEGGLRCGEEFRICVAIAAPKEGGRYAGTWSLITPSGIMFGEKPHMIIQVVNQQEQGNVKRHHQLLEQHWRKPEAGRNEILNEHTTTAVATSRDPVLRRKIDKEIQIEHMDASTVKKINIILQNQADWDSLLKEFQLMGFQDMQLNRRLLLKHKGSIKKAVKELIDMEKSTQ